MGQLYNTLLEKGGYRRVMQLCNCRKKILTRVVITYVGGGNNHSLGSVSLVRLSYEVIIKTQTKKKKKKKKTVVNGYSLV